MSYQRMQAKPGLCSVAFFRCESSGALLDIFHISLLVTLQAKRPNFKPSAPADWAKLTQLQRENETVTIEIESLRKSVLIHLAMLILISTNLRNVP